MSHLTVTGALSLSFHYFPPLNSLGTFVFTFVSQHTVHLVFLSLKSEIRTVRHFQTVSTAAVSVSTLIYVLLGMSVYMTFWEHTESDIFQIYPQGWLIDMAKLLLCVTMILTFPLPFFTCRELLIVTFVHPLCGIEHGVPEEVIPSPPPEAFRAESDLTEPLLETSPDESMETTSDVASIATEISRRIVATATSPKNWLLPDDNRQLRLTGHVALTVKLWIVTTGLAIAAPSYSDTPKEVVILIP